MAENSLKKFVILGCQSPEANIYHAEKHYDELTKIPIELDCLDRIINDIPPEKLPDILGEIAKHPLAESVAIALFLAICAKSENQTVKSNVLKHFSTACSNPKTVLYFIKCEKHVQSLISASKSTKPGIWGASVRRVLAKWYSSFDANTLARLLIKGNTVFGWTHKDILKLIHFKPSSSEIDSVIKYFGFGKAEAKNALSDDLKILANKIEEIKTCKDELRVAAIFEELKLSQYHIPPAFCRSPKFWSEYIKSLDLLKVLQSLEYLLTCKALADTLRSIVISMIDDESGSNIDPSEVFIYLRRYEVGLKDVYKERAFEKKAATAEVKPPAKRDSKGKNKSAGIRPSSAVIAATKSLVTRSLAALTQGSQKWVLTLSAPYATSENCVYHRTTTVAGAAALTAHYCKQIANTFTFLVPPHDSIQIQNDVFETSEQLQKLSPGGKDLQNVFDETLKTIKSQNLDSAIIMCDRKYSTNDDLNKLIENAEKESNIRFAFILLRSDKKLKCSNTNVLLIHGFDAKVLRIISAFLHHEI